MPTVDLGALTEATSAAREALGELRSELKEARRVIREVQQEREAVETMVRRSVADEIAEQLKEGLDRLGEETKVAMDQAVDKVGREFTKLENVFMTGDRRGRPADGRDFRRLTES